MTAAMRQSRLDRGAALARLALRIGGRYAARSPQLVFASVDRRQKLRHELALRSAEEVAEELGSMKGALMELGQMASYIDEDLPPTLRAGLKQFEKADGIREALRRSAEKRAAGQPKVAQELAVVTADITRAEGAIKRYQLAFEAGEMEAQDCGARLQELGIQVRDLRAREAELDLAMTYQTEVEVTDELIAAFHDEILETIEHGTPAQKKAINRRMFVEVIVDGKVAYPKYRVPTAGVRIVGTLVDPRGFEPLTS